MPENIKEKLFSGAPYLLAIVSFFVGEWDGREDAKAESQPVQIHSPVIVSCKNGDVNEGSN